MAKIENFSKVVRPGHITENGRNLPIFCKIEFQAGKLSISGVIAPLRNGDALGGCGQIDMEFQHKNPAHNDSRYASPIRPDQIVFAAGWDAKKWLTFLEIWHKFHLNNLRPYCKHQKKLGWHTERFERMEGRASAELKARVYAPIGYLTKPCPVCGYKYGTAWLTEKVPVAALRFLSELPNSDRTPAWI